MLTFQSLMVKNSGKLMQNNQKQGNVFAKSNPVQSFSQLFLKSSDLKMQEIIPQKMTIQNLVDLVKNNKVEVFINHQNEMHNVTHFFKSSKTFKSLINTENQQLNIDNINIIRKQVPVSQNLKINDKFIQLNLSVDDNILESDKQQVIKKNSNNVILENITKSDFINQSLPVKKVIEKELLVNDDVNKSILENSSKNTPNSLTLDENQIKNNSNTDLTISLKNKVLIKKNNLSNLNVKQNKEIGNAINAESDIQSPLDSNASRFIKSNINNLTSNKNIENIKTAEIKEFAGVQNTGLINLKKNQNEENSSDYKMNQINNFSEKKEQIFTKQQKSDYISSYNKSESTVDYTNGNSNHINEIKNSINNRNIEFDKQKIKINISQHFSILKNAQNIVQDNNSNKKQSHMEQKTLGSNLNFKRNRLKAERNDSLISSFEKISAKKTDNKTLNLSRLIKQSSEIEKNNVSKNGIYLNKSQVSELKKIKNDNNTDKSHLIQNGIESGTIIKPDNDYFSPEVTGNNQKRVNKTTINLQNVEYNKEVSKNVSSDIDVKNISTNQRSVIKTISLNMLGKTHTVFRSKDNVLPKVDQHDIRNAQYSAKQTINNENKSHNVKILKPKISLVKNDSLKLNNMTFSSDPNPEIKNINLKSLGNSKRVESLKENNISKPERQILTNKDNNSDLKVKTTSSDPNPEIKTINLKSLGKSQKMISTKEKIFANPEQHFIRKASDSTDSTIKNEGLNPNTRMLKPNTNITKIQQSVLNNGISASDSNPEIKNINLNSLGNSKSVESFKENTVIKPQRKIVTNNELIKNNDSGIKLKTTSSEPNPEIKTINLNSLGKSQKMISTKEKIFANPEQHFIRKAPDSTDSIIKNEGLNPNTRMLKPNTNITKIQQSVLNNGISASDPNPEIKNINLNSLGKFESVKQSKEKNFSNPENAFISKVLDNVDSKTKKDNNNVNSKLQILKPDVSVASRSKTVVSINGVEQKISSSEVHNVKKIKTWSDFSNSSDSENYNNSLKKAVLQKNPEIISKIKYNNHENSNEMKLPNKVKVNAIKYSNISEKENISESLNNFDKKLVIDKKSRSNQLITDNKVNMKNEDVKFDYSEGLKKSTSSLNVQKNNSFSTAGISGMSYEENHSLKTKNNPKVLKIKEGKVLSDDHKLREINKETEYSDLLNGSTVENSENHHSEKFSFNDKNFSNKQEKNTSTGAVSENKNQEQSGILEDYDVENKVDKNGISETKPSLAHTMQNDNSRNKIMEGDEMIQQKRNQRPYDDFAKNNQSSQNADELFKNHFLSEKPFIINVKNENGQNYFQQVYIEKENISVKGESKQKLTNQDESITKKSEIKNQIVSNNAQNDNQPQNNQSFQQFQNSFNQRTADVAPQQQSRNHSGDYETLYQQIFSKASELRNSAQFEVKTVFEIMTINFGKVNTQIEKQGTTLRINFKTDSKEKETALKENMSDLATNLKQFGFDKIEINVDLDSHSNDNSKQAQNHHNNTKNDIKKQENIVKKETDFSQRRKFGYNSFEYTA